LRLRNSLALIALALAGLGNTCGYVGITNPASGTIYTSAQTVTLSAFFLGTVSRVEFYKNGALRCSDSVGPYECNWAFASADNGGHEWVAKAVLPEGGVWTSAPVALTVAIGGSAAPELVGFIPSPGTARDVAADPARGFAYVASDEFGLTVVDVLNPNAPVAVGAPNPPLFGSSLAASGSLVAVNTNDGLQIVDVSDPTLPETIGTLAVNGTGVAMAGQYAYLRVPVAGNPGHTDLAVVDLRTPSSPRLASQVFLPGGDRVEAAGTYAYVTTGSALAIYDVANPAAPQLRGSITIPNGARELAIAGNTAYVGNLSTVYSIDVTNRASPRIVGQVAAVSTDLALAGTKLYALSGSQFKIIDVSNPGVPLVLGTGTGFSAWSIAVLGNLALLASPAPNELGLYLVDVSVPSAPRTLAELPGVVGNSDIAASGSLVAVTTNDGLQVVDVSDPTLPEAIGTLGVFGTGVAMTGQYAYLRVPVAGNPGHTDLAVVDLRTPSRPTLVSQVYGAGGDRVEVAGTYAYVTTGTALAIYDVANPAAPQLRGSVTIPNGARELAVSGNTAYVGNLSTVSCVDVSNRASPRIVGSVAAIATDLAVVGTKLYALSGTQFKIIDVSNPAAPLVLGTGSGFATSWGIEVVGSRVFLASTAGREVVVFDVANPAQPRLLEAYPVPGDVWSITKTPGFVYVGDRTATVDVLSVGP
jgi:hypothetical protein